MLISQGSDWKLTLRRDGRFCLVFHMGETATDTDGDEIIRQSEAIGYTPEEVFSKAFRRFRLQDAAHWFGVLTDALAYQGQANDLKRDYRNKLMRARRIAAAKEQNLLPELLSELRDLAQGGDA